MGVTNVPGDPCKYVLHTPPHLSYTCRTSCIGNSGPHIIIQRPLIIIFIIIVIFIYLFIYLFIFFFFFLGGGGGCLVGCEGAHTYKMSYLICRAEIVVWDINWDLPITKINYAYHFLSKVGTSKKEEKHINVPKYLMIGTFYRIIHSSITVSTILLMLLIKADYVDFFSTNALGYVIYE